MRDALLSHHAPAVVLLVRANPSRKWQKFAWEYEYSAARFEQLKGDAQGEGWAYGEIRANGRLLDWWPKVEVDGPDCLGTPPEDEPGGYAPVRRRRAA